MHYFFLSLPVICLAVCTLVIRLELHSARHRGTVLSRNEVGQIILALVLGGVAIIFIAYLFLDP